MVEAARRQEEGARVAPDDSVPPESPGERYGYDPADRSKVNHADPYVAYVWAYRAAGLARPAAGEVELRKVVLYASWKLPLPTGRDASRRRVVLPQVDAGEDRSIVHVCRWVDPAER